MLKAEESSSDEEIQRRQREMSRARNLALEGMLEWPPTNDRIDRDTPY